MIQNKSFKYRIYPNKTQKALLNQAFGCVRFVWNKSVEGFNNRVNVNLNELKSDNPFLNDVSCAILQQKLRDFSEFKNRFFKGGCSRPNFKKKSKYNSLRLPNQKIRFKGSRVRLEKIGWIKLVMDRSFDGRVISATVSKKSTGQYFISVCCETEIQPLPPSDTEVGLDLGIKYLVVTSDAEIIDNPKFLRDKQAKISRLQTFLAKKKRGSKRWIKTRIKIAKLYQKVVNQRKYFLHNITNSLISRYGIIYIEDLDVANMTAKGVNDASIGELTRQLEYKSDWMGRTLNRIDRFYPSSQICSLCWQRKKIKLSERIYHCNCGNIMSRDLNSAINIKAVGVKTAQRLSSASIL